MDNSEKFEKNYYDIKLPGSYSGLESFYKELKKRKINVEKSTLRDWLKTQDTYTLHKSARKKIKRNKTFVYGIDHIWQADLCDVSNISKYNDGYNYLLTCIDVFSKYAWAIPLKQKSATAITYAFEQIFKDGRKPIKLHTDEGKEFFNKTLQKLLEENNIGLYKTNSEMKAAVVERFNRTLKEKMFRYFTFNNTFKYKDMLSDLLNNYNNSHHRTINTTPNSVNDQTEFEVWKTIYKLKRDKSEKIKFKFKIGDQVLINKNKQIFAKGYTPKWVREVFIIKECLLRSPPVYKIIDRLGRDILGVFYEDELQKVVKSKFSVEKILDRRLKDGKKEILVRWYGYSEDFDSWILESELDKNELLRNNSK